MTNEEAIKWFENRYDNSPMPGAKMAFRMAIEALKAQESDKWILCSKRTPETNDQVSVTWINHNPEVYYTGIKDKPFTESAHYHNGNWYWHSPVTKDFLDEYGSFEPDLVDVGVEIVAWKPMPEPYKEAEHDK